MKRSGTISGLLCLLLLAGLCARCLAQQSAEARYRITGKVIDAHTAAALPRCSVQIGGVKDRSQTQSIIADEQGGFTFNGLPAGKYSLTAEKRGYLAQSYEEHEEFSTAIATGPGLDSENLLFRLVSEAMITGTVVDEAGEPVRGAQVRLFADQNSGGRRTTQQRHTAITDDRGIYELLGLRPGAYFLVVSGHPWYAQHLPTPGSGQEQVQALDVAYPTVFYPGVTDQDSATPIPIQGGERLQADFTLAAQPALRLHLAAPAADPDGGVSVMLSQTIFGQVEAIPAQVMSEPGGGVEVDGALPGRYEVTLTRFIPGQGRSDSKHFTAELSGGATELPEDSGAGEITVAGRVRAASGKLPRMAGISLRSSPDGRQQYAALNESGEFSMSVFPGTYEIAGNIGGMYLGSIKATGTTIAGRMLMLKAGDNPKLEIIADAGHGEVEGIALRGDKTASAVMVLLAPEDPANNAILFRRDQSDSDGTYDLPDVVPGRYHLLAIEDGWQLEWAKPSVLQAFLSKSIAVEVKAGAHLNERVQVQAK